jgi:hypothetical protein
LENVSLADFAAYYDKVRGNEDDDEDNPDSLESGTVNDFQLTPKKRRQPRVIRFVRFSEDDPENYSREKLMLYTHWRNEDVDLYGRFETYQEHYNHIKPSLLQQLQTYEPFIDALNTAEAALAANSREEQWDLLAPSIQQLEEDAQHEGPTDAENFSSVNPEAQNYTHSYDIGLDIGLAGTSASEIVNQRYNMSDDDYLQLMRSLNSEQMEFLYDTVKMLKTTDPQVFRFLSGGAGTGKSYVLRALRETMERFYKSRCGSDFTKQSCMTIAPTGKAAFLVQGNTVHSALHVPASQKLQYSRLDPDTLNTLRNQIVISSSG